LIYVDGYEHPVYQYIFYRYRKNTKVKTYLGYRGTKASQRFKGNIYNVLRRFLFSNADFVVTAGEDSTRAAMDCGISRERILELFNPIDTDYFKPSSFETWQEDSPHKFLYVGQLIKRKNIDQIIKAFSICREIGDTLEIVGVGEEHNSLFEIMNDLDLGTSIVFRGGLSQHELFSLYNSAHTLVLVSHREVWGLVVNEALSCGMHVVISKNIGSYNSVKNMPGVYACNLGEEEIALAMAQSKTKFRGRILNPQIRSLSTTNFAQKLSDYFES
jgi:glycosyltransferase involved in cell wall biosynthesis